MPNEYPEISLKVNQCINNIQSYWIILQSYKANNPKAYKMYAMFYFDILNNKEKRKRKRKRIKQ